MTDGFGELVGQEHVVATLRAAAADAAAVRAGADSDGSMTHAWLVTGPPGSGRSVAALAFAAALVCPRGGCGECEQCTAVRHSAHVDVEHVVPEGVEYSVAEARDLVARSALAPARSPWHVFVVEDADRLNDASANTLLKSVEEPPQGTVWVLCAPSTEDVLPTIRSRCRHVLRAAPGVDLRVRRDDASPDEVRGEGVLAREERPEGHALARLCQWRSASAWS